MAYLHLQLKGETPSNGLFPQSNKKGAYLQCVTFAVTTNAQAIQPLYKKAKTAIYY